MDVFDLGNEVIANYGSYVRSFLSIDDPVIDRRAQQEMDAGLLWPAPLVQLKPAFEPGETLLDPPPAHPSLMHPPRKETSSPPTPARSDD